MFNKEINDISQGKRLLCAIYTRKSHVDGLEQEFNSLDAQRESAEAYIKSQKMLGWETLPDRYDDGGFSGGTMERPALKRLLADVDRGKVDVIVVYKIDRLSRSLLDFSHMIHAFEEMGVSFVSVTQQISTTDSTGKMMLNTLMTFAQYEREVIAERIRDKVAAAKRKGKYCGGVPILGYDVNRNTKKLEVNRNEAELVRFIFRRYTQLGAAKQLAKELNEQGYTTKSWTAKNGRVHQGGKWNTGQIYRALNNRLYIGEVHYKGENFEGEHDAIINKELWDKVQKLLKENTVAKISKAKTKSVSPLHGVIRCGHCDSAMGITYAQKGGRRYTYFLCSRDSKRAVSTCPLKRIPAGDIEKVVLEQLGVVFRTPTIIAASYRSALANDVLKGKDGNELTEQDFSNAFQSIETFWEDLIPLERNRIVQLLVERITIKEDGIDIELKTRGLTDLVAEVAASFLHKPSPFASYEIAMENSQINDKPTIRINERGNLIIHVPMIIRRQGGRKIIIAPNGDVKDTPEVAQNAVVQALARAFAWQEALDCGKVKSVSDLARKLGLDNSYVARILKLTTLAPDIIEAIINDECFCTFPIGSVESRNSLAQHQSSVETATADAERRKPRQWSLAKLVKSFPENWEEQRKMFGVH